MLGRLADEESQVPAAAEIGFQNPDRLQSAWCRNSLCHETVPGSPSSPTFLKPEQARPTGDQQRTRNNNANPVGWRFVKVLLAKTV